MLKQLINLFITKNGRSPNALEMLQLKFKAAQHSAQQAGKGEVIQFPRDKITDWTKARPQPPKIEIINGIQTTRGLGDLLPKQIEKIKKQNKESIKRFKDKMKDPPEDLAGGGIAGMLGEPTYQDEEHRVPYKDGEFVEGPDKYSPKNFYGVGFGPLLNEFMSEGKPRDEEGFHTTLNKNDLINLWNYLKEDQDINLEDELMFRFGRFDPEKKSQFHIGIGKDNKEIGWKKKFNEGGRVPYQDGEFVKKEDLPSGLKA